MLDPEGTSIPVGNTTPDVCFSFMFMSGVRCFNRLEVIFGDMFSLATN